MDNLIWIYSLGCQNFSCNLHNSKGRLEVEILRDIVTLSDVTSSWYSMTEIQYSKLIFQQESMPAQSYPFPYSLQLTFNGYPYSGIVLTFRQNFIGSRICSPFQLNK